MATCCIALGGNVGDTSTLFDQALNALNDNHSTVIRKSSVLRTPPMGKSAGDDFLNAAAVLETSREPAELLQELHRIESILGRERSIHWGPRQIDLDLLLYEQQVIDTASLVVPHPAMWYRRFVLEPLTQIAPDFLHPVLRQSVSQLNDQLKLRPLTIVISDPSDACGRSTELQQSLDDRLGCGVVRLLSNPTPHHQILATIQLNCDSHAARQRSQPVHERDRTIRVFAEPNQRRDKLAEALMDICSAAIG